MEGQRSNTVYLVNASASLLLNVAKVEKAGDGEQSTAV